MGLHDRDDRTVLMNDGMSHGLISMLPGRAGIWCGDRTGLFLTVGTRRLVVWMQAGCGVCATIVFTPHEGPRVGTSDHRCHHELRIVREVTKECSMHHNCLGGQLWRREVMRRQYGITPCAHAAGHASFIGVMN